MAEQKKVILVGSSGCGKTTLFQYLTGGEVTLKPPSTPHCSWAPLEGNTNISIVDTPGLESDDDEWWDQIQPHSKVHMVIIMFNGTNDRLQNLNKLNYVHKTLQGSETHLKVLAIKGNNFEHEEFKYMFLTDHTGRFTYNSNFKSLSCTGQITREKIKEEISNNLPENSIELFSPIKLISALEKKKKDLENALIRNNELDESLMKSQKENAANWKLYETLKQEYDRQVIVSQGYEMALQRARAMLLDNYCVVDEGGNVVEANTDGWGWHFISWLPFAGNVMLERKRQSEKKIAEIAKSITKTSTIPPKPDNKNNPNVNNNNNQPPRVNPPKKEDILDDDEDDANILDGASDDDSNSSNGGDVGNVDEIDECVFTTNETGGGNNNHTENANLL